MFSNRKTSAFAIAKVKGEIQQMEKKVQKKKMRREAKSEVSMDMSEGQLTKNPTKLKYFNGISETKDKNFKHPGPSKVPTEVDSRIHGFVNLDFGNIPNFTSTPMNGADSHRKRTAPSSKTSVVAGAFKEPSTNHQKKKHKKKARREPVAESKIDQETTQDKMENPTPPRKRRKVVSTGFVNHTEDGENGEIVLDDQACNMEHPDSQEEARACFQWLINPHKTDKFFSHIWEKKPMYIKRDNPFYFKDVFSTSALDNILKKEKVMFTKNLDVTSYTDGVRETHNPEGRAFRGVVWDYYENGCSVRMLNPQTFSKSVMRLCGMLQEFFGSFVGANVYLTPPGTQGFAPHYDDIEAFVIQLEGTKKWKIYPSRGEEEVLPRYSSGNFTPDDVGEPVMEVDLKPGDLLYFPRGTIHEACTNEDTHSLHITLSTYQKTSWADLLEKLIPAALNAAVEDDEEFRRGLPLRYLDHTGICNSDKGTTERELFTEKLHYLMNKLVQYAHMDVAADQMAKGFIHDSLPPILTQADKGCSIHGAGERWERGKVVDRVELDPDVEIRILRPSILRIVTDSEVEDNVRIYHSLTNSKEYHGEEPQFFELDSALASAMEYLIQSYPEFVRIEDLPLDNQQTKMELSSQLYDRGLIVTKVPLDIVEDM